MGDVITLREQVQIEMTLRELTKDELPIAYKQQLRNVVELQAVINELRDELFAEMQILSNLAMRALRHVNEE